DQVAKVCLGEQGIFSVMGQGSLFIDCSTIEVEQSRALHAAAMEHALVALDAPVSGGVVGASQGTLTFMVGGLPEAVNMAKPFLLCMGKTILHTGEAGRGQAAKQCNNMLLGITMVAVSEVFLLAESLGLSPQTLAQVVTQSSGQCWVMSRYVPVPDVLADVPANHGYAPGFTSDMMLKDLRLAQASAQASGLNLPLGSMAEALYAAAHDDYGSLDFSSIIKSLQSAEN
ncbi:MAG: NAD-binding protein, partial [Legionellaceae bacterium]